MEPIWRPLWGALHTASDELPNSIDVLVIGAGIAGVTSALELQRAGRTTVLVEAREPGTGTTGRTTAKVTAGQACIYSKIADRNGMDIAHLYAQGQREALDYFRQRNAESVTHYVFSDNGAEDLTIETEVTRALGFDTTLHFENELPGAAAALAYPDQFQINPKEWLDQLLDEYRRLGGQVVTHVRVTNIEDREPCIVETEGGQITATDVVVATHFPISHQVLGAPRLSTEMALVVGGPSTLTIPGTWISHDDELSIRTATDAEGPVLIISGEAHRNGEFDTAAAYHRLGELAQMRFGVTELKYFWSAHDLWTEDHLPYVGLHLPTSKHVYVASGFGSWGMTNGTLAGLMLARMLTIGIHPLEQALDPRRIGFVPPTTQTIRESGEAIKHLVGERVTKAFATEVDLHPGQGEVIREGTNFVAVCRDSQGTLHRVSAACTHLGCLVSWNQGDQTWDCPCHGSRFQATGEVIEGPATAKLETLQ